MSKGIVGRGTAVVTTATVVIPINPPDLAAILQRQLTLIMAYSDLTDITAIDALLEWGIAAEGTLFAPGRDNSGTPDTALAGTVDGVYSKIIHSGGDIAQLTLTPTGAPGSVTVHWAIVG